MSGEAYTLLALAARYWFVILIVFIAAQCMYVCYRQFRIGLYIAHSIARMGTDTSAALFVLSDAEKKIENGTRFPLQEESVIGYGAGCDIRLPKGSCEKRHATVWMRGEQIFIRPIAKAPVALNGELLREDAEVYAGDIVQIGSILFKLGKEVIPDEAH